jgi:hypothetical protein
MFKRDADFHAVKVTESMYAEGGPKYPLYKYGSPAVDCFDKYGHTSPITDGLGACYEKGRFEEYRAKADEWYREENNKEVSFKYHNCWKHFTAFNVNASDGGSKVYIKFYDERDVTPNTLLAVLVCSVLVVILIELLLTPSSRVMKLYKKDKSRRINWHNTKKQKLNSLAKRYMKAPKTENLPEHDPNYSAPRRKWLKCFRLLNDVRSRQAGKLWNDVLDEYIAPKKKNRKIGEGDSVPFNYKDVWCPYFGQKIALERTPLVPHLLA